MPVTKERMGRLREFGLSEYGARAYLALLDLGTAEARAIAGLSRVPASKVYHTLDQLHQKGLVILLAESPKRFAPVPFGTYLDTLRDEHLRRAQAIREERAHIAGQLAGRRAMHEASAGAGATFLRGAQVRERLAELLSGAKDSCLVVVGSPVKALRIDELLLDASARLDVRIVEAGGGEGMLVLPDEAGALLVHHDAHGQPVALHAEGPGAAKLLRALAETALRANSWASPGITA